MIKVIIKLSNGSFILMLGVDVNKRYETNIFFKCDKSEVSKTPRFHSISKGNKL